MRRSYRCECGEWGYKGGREIVGSLDNDAGENALRAIEKACGERLVTCPWRALLDPFVARVMESHRWWKERQLAAKWGGEDRIPAVIVRGIEVYDAALNRVRAYDIREQAKRDREEHERRMAEMTPRAGPRPQPARWHRRK